VGCEKGCPCTGEERVNFCLEKKGGDQLPDTVKYIREIKSNDNSPSKYDTLQQDNPKCLKGLPGRQRVRVVYGDSLLYQSEWVEIETTDCCNQVDGKKIELDF
jgi:hypothetical protein